MINQQPFLFIRETIDSAIMIHVTLVHCNHLFFSVFSDAFDDDDTFDEAIGALNDESLNVEFFVKMCNQQVCHF